jgi:hypothetical protein
MLRSRWRVKDSSEQEQALERLALQISVAVGGLVPVAGGMSGVICGARSLGEAARGPADSQVRFLSGLLAAIGIAYWTTIPDIEKAGARFQLLTLIIVAGGFARAIGMLIAGPPGPLMSAALGLELVVAPALFLWQSRIQRLAEHRSRAPTPVDAEQGQS